jgi:hypothetical protein
MRKRVKSILTGALLLVCSLALVSCDAITAQKITNPGTGSFNGMNGGGRNGLPGMNGDRGTKMRPGFNGGQGVDGRVDGNGGQSGDGSADK